MPENIAFSWDNEFIPDANSEVVPRNGSMNMDIQRIPDTKANNESFVASNQSRSRNSAPAGATSRTSISLSSRSSSIDGSPSGVDQSTTALLPPAKRKRAILNEGEDEKTVEIKQQTSNFNGPLVSLNIPRILPHEKVFQIQVGGVMFTLSGASLSSDGPSYFTNFFRPHCEHGNDEIPVLYIDRDPRVFRQIVKHLQGYHIVPADDIEFVYLYADAYYYQLSKLVKHLFEREIFLKIGSKSFRVPREIFKGPGDSPNFFDLGFSSFFIDPQVLNSGSRGLIRPPTVAPPCVPSHSPELFEQLVVALENGYIHIESEEHRDRLLRECRYYHFLGLEQKLIPTKITYNCFLGQEEITLRLKDIRPQGIIESDVPNDEALPSTLQYKRPHIDSEPRDMVLEITEDSALLRPQSVEILTDKAHCKWFIEFHEQSKVRERMDVLIKKLTQISPESKASYFRNNLIRLPCAFVSTYFTIDKEPIDLTTQKDLTVEINFESNEMLKKRKSVQSDCTLQVSHGVFRPLMVRKAQFSLRIFNKNLVVFFHYAETIGTVKELNSRREFLTI
ncbi:hypothetical protein V1511DRAFT_498889 [Dipodascopsis uninucleata]